MTGLKHLLPELKIYVLLACRRLSVSPQSVDCVSRYSASDHLQMFEADVPLSTPKILSRAKLSHYR